MANRKNKLMRYHERVMDKKTVKAVDGVLVHGYMIYKCEACGRQWNMYLQQGIEEFGDKHKPSPFIIRCKCGGMAQDVSGIIKLRDYTPLLDYMSYFADQPDSDCGVPILKY